MGSSIKLGVGGGKGLSELYVAEVDGVNGSWLRSGKLSPGRVGLSKVTDLMKATVHVSGFVVLASRIL